MAHTYISALVHVVFSTKGRQRTISAELQPKLWDYLGGIARRNGMTAVQAGGIADHVHVLLILPATMPIAKAVQLLKGGSSKWIHDTEGKSFAWQMDMAPSPSAFPNCKPRSHTFATRRNTTANAPSKRSFSHS